MNLTSKHETSPLPATNGSRLTMMLHSGQAEPPLLAAYDLGGAAADALRFQGHDLECPPDDDAYGGCQMFVTSCRHPGQKARHYL